MDAFKNQETRIVSRPLVLLADTTVLYSALAFDGLEKKVLLSGGYILVTTDFNTAEIYRILVSKRGLSGADALALIGAMPVLVAKRSALTARWEEAERLIGGRDMSDVPLVALALAIEGIQDGIWSSDRDFEVIRGRFRLWKARQPAKG